LRDSQILRAVDELTRALAGRIPAPDRADTPDSAYKYELQVGAFLDHQRALDQRHVLKSMGYPASVHTELHRKAIWHRVMVGPYAEEDEAIRVLQKLEGLLGSRPFLRRRPL
jgi:cell division protein FtsN